MPRVSRHLPVEHPHRSARGAHVYERDGVGGETEVADGREGLFWELGGAQDAVGGAGLKEFVGHGG